jgi:SAM-dependent methyltransferase
MIRKHMGKIPEKLCNSPADDAETLQFYVQEAEVYTATGPKDPTRELAGFLNLLAPGARVLELGCGNGRDSAAMLALGFQVDATDGVADIARQAELRIGHPVRVLRFDQLEAKAEYDGVWAQASLLHVPRPALPGVLARVFEALRPGGVHCASFKTGGAEGRDGFGRYYNYLSLEEVIAAYRASAPWTILSTQEHNCADYEGVERTWVVIMVRRPHGPEGATSSPYQSPK